jgi:predicted alpha/beta-fold hydrolase
MVMIYKFLKMPFFGRFMTKQWINPLRPEQQEEWQPHRIRSRSGGNIAVLHARASGEARATMVLAHPMGKEAKGYFIKNGYADFYRQCGYNTVIFDVNGFGESTHGSFSYFEDILAVGKLVSQLYPGLPLGYHGISLGGQWGVLAFTDLEHNYDFAVIESAPTTLEEFWIKFPFAYRVLKLFSLLLPAYSKKIRMIDRISELKKLQTILFIYSETDDYTPVAMGKRFLEKSNVPAELWVVENAEHAKVMRSAYKEAYQQKLLAFVERSIEVVGKRATADAAG